MDAGLEKELVLGDPTAPRFVLWGGELLPTPSGPDVVTFRLLSLWGKIRAGLGAIGIKQAMPGAKPCHLKSESPMLQLHRNAPFALHTARHGNRSTGWCHKVKRVQQHC